MLASTVQFSNNNQHPHTTLDKKAGIEGPEPRETAAPNPRTPGEGAGPVFSGPNSVSTRPLAPNPSRFPLPTLWGGTGLETCNQVW